MDDLVFFSYHKIFSVKSLLFSTLSTDRVSEFLKVLQYNEGDTLKSPHQVFVVYSRSSSLVHCEVHFANNAADRRRQRANAKPHAATTQSYIPEFFFLVSV